MSLMGLLYPAVVVPLFRVTQHDCHKLVSYLVEYDLYSARPATVEVGETIDVFVTCSARIFPSALCL